MLLKPVSGPVQEEYVNETTAHTRGVGATPMKAGLDGYCSAMAKVLLDGSGPRASHTPSAATCRRI